MSEDKYFKVIEEVSCYSCERHYISLTLEVVKRIENGSTPHCKLCKQLLRVDTMLIHCDSSFYGYEEKSKVVQHKHIRDQLAVKTQNDIIDRNRSLERTYETISSPE